MSPWPSKDGQFLISDGTDPAPAGATRHFLASVVVDVFGPLPVIQVRDQSERLIGLLLGTLIDLTPPKLPKTLSINFTR